MGFERDRKNITETMGYAPKIIIVKWRKSWRNRELATFTIAKVVVSLIKASEDNSNKLVKEASLCRLENGTNAIMNVVLTTQVLHILSSWPITLPMSVFVKQSQHLILWVYYNLETLFTTNMK